MRFDAFMFDVSVERTHECGIDVDGNGCLDIPVPKGPSKTVHYLSNPPTHVRLDNCSWSEQKVPPNSHLHLCYPRYNNANSTNKFNKKEQ